MCVFFSRVEWYHRPTLRVKGDSTFRWRFHVTLDSSSPIIVDWFCAPFADSADRLRPKNGESTRVFAPRDVFLPTANTIGIPINKRFWCMCLAQCKTRLVFTTRQKQAAFHFLLVFHPGGIRETPSFTAFPFNYLVLTTCPKEWISLIRFVMTRRPLHAE